MSAFLTIGFFLIRPLAFRARWHFIIIYWLLTANIAITHMTIVLGGFTSTYYSGLNLVFLAVAVIVPLSWPTHLVGQIGSISYYYAAHFLGEYGDADLSAAIENLFFFGWTCVATICSVFLTERLMKTAFHARQSDQQARQELEVSNRKLLQLDKLKSQFFANISHELRTPLTLILGAFRTLKKRLFDSNKEKEILNSGIRNTDHLLYLINELLDLAKFESGRAELHKSSFDLAMLVREVSSNFESSQPGQLYVCGSSDPVPIEADSQELKKVLFNLLSNAYKFSDPEIRKVWVRLVSHDNWITVEVEDNGIGIPQDHVNTIFDRFVQVEDSSTRRFEGSGIGLALVREVVTAHGGTVTVNSAPGQGACFTLRLPRGNVESESMASLKEAEDRLPTLVPEMSSDQPNSSTINSSSPGSQSLVLIVEDNMEMRAYLNRILGEHYQILTAKDGAEGFEHAKSYKPDLILTDAMMPRMSGDDLLRAVRNEKELCSTPVVMLTARAGTTARVESIEAGADDYLTKPFEESEVLARVGNLIKTRAQERRLRELERNRLAQFLPTHVAARLLTNEADSFLKPHRRDITVLFIDLRGFTAFAESGEPEDVLEVLEMYQMEVGRLTDLYQGTLGKFSGDGVIVYFNDLVTVINHPEQAVRLALALRDKIRELRGLWLKRGYELGAGIGIATGYATIGVVGSEMRKEYTVIGTVPNLAARLCDEAKHGQILAPERLLNHVEHLVVSEPLGKITLKGLQRPVNVYNVLGLREKNHES